MVELGSIAELLDVSQLEGPEIALRVGVVAAGLLGSYAALRLLRFAFKFARISAGLSSVPSAPGGLPLIGHVVPLMNGPKEGKAAWDVMEEWIKAKGPIVKFNILGTQGVCLREPLALKRIFQTGYKIYEKDLELSYRPFLPILGTGLVTADGELWQKQRLLMAPALRIDMLDEIVPIAKRATDRLSAKLEQYRGTGKVRRGCMYSMRMGTAACTACAWAQPQGLACIMGMCMRSR